MSMVFKLYSLLHNLCLQITLFKLLFEKRILLKEHAKLYEEHKDLRNVLSIVCLKLCDCPGDYITLLKIVPLILLETRDDSYLL